MNYLYGKKLLLTESKLRTFLSQTASEAADGDHGFLVHEDLRYGAFRRRDPLDVRHFRHPVSVCSQMTALKLTPRRKMQGNFHVIALSLLHDCKTKIIRRDFLSLIYIKICVGKTK